MIQVSMYPLILPLYRRTPKYNILCDSLTLLQSMLLPLIHINTISIHQIMKMLFLLFKISRNTLHSFNHVLRLTLISEIALSNQPCFTLVIIVNRNSKLFFD